MPLSTETRKQLGEYYTPDWLADQVVSTAVTDPLNQRVLDPACGSGTFLFHAVRRYLDAAAEAGIALDRSLTGLTDHVLGVDLHSVAVTLARVTYLLAIGRERLMDSDRGAVTVPVYWVTASSGTSVVTCSTKTTSSSVQEPVTDSSMSSSVSLTDSLLTLLTLTGWSVVWPIRLPNPVYRDRRRHSRPACSIASRSRPQTVRWSRRSSG
ncbi:MAG: N-6 DNA methylase [Pseudonocardiales bacterium]|nr:N-6 DNA methylase [Pseudonocardiales bacterium]